MHRKTFEYANSFEDFLKMLQRTNDIEMLKSIRCALLVDDAEIFTLNIMVAGMIL